jgi:hypothetical protein
MNLTLRHFAEALGLPPTALLTSQITNYGWRCATNAEGGSM